MIGAPAPPGLVHDAPRLRRVLDALAPPRRRLPEPRRVPLPDAPHPARILELAGHPPGACLLESGGALGPVSRRTLLFLAPVASLEAFEIGPGRSELVLRAPAGDTALRWRGDPIASLETISRVMGPAAPAALPFTGGAVVSLSHELIRLIEPGAFAPLPPKAPREALLRAHFYGAALVHDRMRGRIELVESLQGAGAALLEAAARATAAGDPPPSERRPPPPPPLAPLRTLPEGVASSLGRAAYLAAVRRIQESIRAGDSYEVNLTQRLELPSAPPPPAIHAALRRLGPTPFSAFADLPGATIVSSSPERFLCARGQRIESRPIKGTRPRGAATERGALRALLSSAKDRAENLMICDLARNDLGRVARVGSVRVERLCRPERHPSVYHLVSTVSALRAAGVGPAELIRAAFPPGSMTGAPKIRTCQLIDALEPVARGPYAGALGYVSSNGNLDLSVLIRALVRREGRVTLGVGGAVTADSLPEEEYAESLAKATVPVAALRMAERG